jgi:hypothetical protein
MKKGGTFPHMYLRVFIADSSGIGAVIGIADGGVAGGKGSA